jgi:N-acetylneuraminate synthase
VHSPELFEGEHLLDLAADDDTYRERSLRELQRVIDVTRDLAPRFTTDRPPIIVNVGGFTRSRSAASSDPRPLYERVAAALERLDTDGVEIIPQTMPPFPWLLGGQLHHRLFVDPDTTDWFCDRTGVRLCLDLSHSQLAATHLGIPFSELLEVVAPRAAHLHVVDAEGVDGEGLQIGDGEIDFRAVCRQLDELAPGVSFIPEIWQGHVDGGRPFWVALDRLSRWWS